MATTRSINTFIGTETLSEFYQRNNQPLPVDLLEDKPSRGHFNVKLSANIAKRTPYNRRDYYKVCLSNGEASGILHYNGEDIVLDRPCLIFTNPSVPASIEMTSPNSSRFYCLFDKRFIGGYLTPDVQYACALFNHNLPPVIPLNDEDKTRLHGYFAEQQALLTADYPYKWDMIRNLLILIIHEGIRLQQNGQPEKPPQRDKVVTQFFDLLNCQYPVASPENAVKLLTPSDYAARLHVHVNHLNSLIKKHTGKPTRAIIHEKIVFEARALLRNTDWNISEIAYALGFEYPSHFNRYFKQLTALTPHEYRTGTMTPPVPQL